MFLRYQSAVPNRRGTFPGVFALANGLRDDGRLSAEDHAWILSANAEGQAAYADPSTIDPTCYDRQQNPGACSWFREEARELLEMTQPYLELLDRYGIPWVQLRTSSPGRIIYEDAVQVVAAPFRYEEHWALSRPAS